MIPAYSAFKTAVDLLRDNGAGTFDPVTMNVKSLYDRFMNGGTGGAAVFSAAFVSSSGIDYWETTATTPTIIATFPYVGTGLYIPTKFRIIASRSGTAGSAYLRLYNPETNLVLSTITWTASGKVWYSGALANLPAGESMIELHGYTSTGNAKSCRVHGAFLG